MDFTANIHTIVITIVSIIIGLTVHEAMHAYVGFLLGDTTAQEEGRISLNPLRHIDPFTTVILPLITLITLHAPILAAKPVPFNPNRVKYDEFGWAMIAAAGPLSNMALAIIVAIVYRFTGGAFADFVGIFAVLNVGLFVFNMVPIPPLDGSRVLYAFAPGRLQEFMMQIEPFGFFIVFGLVLAVPGFGDLLLNIENAVLNFLFRL
jgi:Zn-dependent protease